MMMRDPRAAIAGIIKGRTTDFGYLPDFTYNMIFETWLQGSDIKEKYSNELGDRLKIIKNEDLHISLDSHMRDIAAWLKVDFNKGMLLPTNANGCISKPDSRYLDDENNKIDYSEFYSPENIRKRWLSVLSDKRDLLVVETILRNIMTEFGYNRITKSSYASYVAGIILFLLPNHALFTKWKNDYPNINELARIGKRLGYVGSIRVRLWTLLPSLIKFIILITISVSRRIRLYYLPGNRWKRYDQTIIK